MGTIVGPDTRAVVGADAADTETERDLENHGVSAESIRSASDERSTGD